MDDTDVLKGWKEIAAFLSTTDRTAQRWESSLALPVYRVETSKSAVVFASRRELSEWMRTAGRQALSKRHDERRTVDVSAVLHRIAESRPHETSCRPASSTGRAKRGLTWVLLASVAAAALLGMQIGF